MLTDKHLEKQPVEKILFVVGHGILPKYILACKKLLENLTSRFSSRDLRCSA